MKSIHTLLKMTVSVALLAALAACVPADGKTDYSAHFPHGAPSQDWGIQDY